jgi:hypothetical protein
MQARLAPLRFRQAMKFTKPDLHLLVLFISALVMFALAGAPSTPLRPSWSSPRWRYSSFLSLGWSGSC